MKNVLVVIKDCEDEISLLDKALCFSPEILSVIVVNPVGVSEGDITSRIADVLAKKGKTETKLLTRFFYEIDANLTADYLIDAANTDESDLMVLNKPEISEQLDGLDLIKSLLRSAFKTKLLLVRRKKWADTPNIMVTLDVESDDASQRVQDKFVFKYAAEILKNTLSAQLHLASILGVSRISDALDIVDAASVLQKKGAALKEKLLDFEKMQACSGSIIHVAAGIPANEITSLAKKQAIDIVVIGSVGRKGLKGLVIGNTAEKIIKNLSCDAFVINGLNH